MTEKRLTGFLSDSGLQRMNLQMFWCFFWHPLRTHITLTLI